MVVMMMMNSRRKRRQRRQKITKKKRQRRKRKKEEEKAKKKKIRRRDKGKEEEKAKEEEKRRPRLCNDYVAALSVCSNSHRCLAVLIKLNCTIAVACKLCRAWTACVVSHRLNSLRETSMYYEKHFDVLAINGRSEQHCTKWPSSWCSYFTR